MISATYKLKKRDLQSEGFNPEMVGDGVLMLDAKQKKTKAEQAFLAQFQFDTQQRREEEERSAVTVYRWVPDDTIDELGGWVPVRMPADLAAAALRIGTAITQEAYDEKRAEKQAQMRKN